MANVSLNLATRSIAERLAIHGDLIACKLRLIKPKSSTANLSLALREWRAMVGIELEKIPEPMRQAVKDALNLRAANDR